jgi:hypothetical protein
MQLAPLQRGHRQDRQEDAAEARQEIQPASTVFAQPTQMPAAALGDSLSPPPPQLGNRGPYAFVAEPGGAADVAGGATLT